MQMKEGGTNVQVKWVPSDLTVEQLTEIFAQFGTVKRWGRCTITQEALKMSSRGRSKSSGCRDITLKPPAS